MVIWERETYNKTKPTLISTFHFKMVDQKIVAAVMLLIAVVSANAVPDKYTTQYDNIDVNEVLRSDRLLKNYFRCLMERGPCTPEGSEIKHNLPDALKTNCEKCSAAQKNKTRTIICFLEKNKQSDFSELVKKYDPQNVYMSKADENFLECKNIGY